MIETTHGDRGRWCISLTRNAGDPDDPDSTMVVVGAELDVDRFVRFHEFLDDPTADQWCELVYAIWDAAHPHHVVRDALPMAARIAMAQRCAALNGDAAWWLRGCGEA